MAAAILAIKMAAVIIRNYRMRRNLRRNRIFRDRLHPLDRYDDVELYSKFRFRRQDILAITDELQDRIELPNRKGALPPVLQVLLTLRFYACGSFQDVCGELIGVHQSTACRTIKRVTNAFMPCVREWILFPTQEEAEQTKAKFFRESNFPNVIGCIDGTQVRIQSPGVQGYEHEYVNRKNYHSINVQVVCDAELLFIDVIARWPGSTHDARILRESDLFENFERNPKPIQGILLGDSGYMLRDWLITPLLNPLTRKEQNFNFHQSSARTTVERAIGVAKRRWHCLQGLRVSPAKACQIITVCLMLSNRARLLALPEFDDEAGDDEEDDDEPDNQPQDLEAIQHLTERVRTAAGKAARDRLIQAYF